MNPIKIINKYHNPDSKTYRILLTHSILVTNLALKIADKFPNTNKKFIYEASMLHDIGYKFPNFETKDKKLLKKLKKNYISHGFWGSLILQKEKLNKHAKVAANHVGTGIYKDDILENNLPIPLNNYYPEALEEEIISYADIFYSKKPKKIFHKETVDQIEKEILSYHKGEEKFEIFKEWHRKFKD